MPATGVNDPFVKLTFKPTVRPAAKELPAGAKMTLNKSAMSDDWEIPYWDEFQVRELVSDPVVEGGYVLILDDDAKVPRPVVFETNPAPESEEVKAPAIQSARRLDWDQVQQQQQQQPHADDEKKVTEEKGKEPMTPVWKRPAEVVGVREQAAEKHSC